MSYMDVFTFNQNAYNYYICFVLKNSANSISLSMISFVFFEEAVICYIFVNLFY